MDLSKLSQTTKNMLHLVDKVGMIKIKVDVDRNNPRLDCVFDEFKYLNSVGRVCTYFRTVESESEMIVIASKHVVPFSFLV